LLRPNLGWFSTSINYVRQKCWKAFYECQSRWAIHDEEWQYINYGCMPLDGSPLVEINDTMIEKNGKTSIQLYYEVIKAAMPLHDKNIVEVGSGRGGGAVYIATHWKPKTMTCIEISNDCVLFANQYQKPKCPNVLHFQQGDATALPLLDTSYDVILNIESSHCYSSFLTFVQEVYHILQPGGLFVMCDMRLTKYVPQMEAEMEQAGFTILENVDITPNVLKSLEVSTEERAKLIREINSTLYVRCFNIFYSNYCGLKGSQMYQKFYTGHSQYKRYVLQKPLLDKTKLPCMKNINYSK
jgi:ubiquinone/menaquinone biosynthesis C-methylase UbiE